MNRFVIISGCSGGGKSTLLAELQRRKYCVVEESGRRIVKEEADSGGQALPWLDMAAFLRRVIDAALADYAHAPRSKAQWVFFDRSLIDAAAALHELTGDNILDRLKQGYRYHPRVFLAPPWPEIYVHDSERRHDMSAALVEFERLRRVYPFLGYTVSLLPRASVIERADFVLKALSAC